MQTYSYHVAAVKVSTTVHSRNPGRHFPQVILRTFLAFLMAPGALLESELVKYMSPNIKIPLNLDMKVQKLHRTTYFTS